MYILFNVKYQLFLSYFSQTRISSTYFQKKKKFQCYISLKFVTLEPSCSMRTVRQTDGRTGVTKLTVSFRNSANSSENNAFYSEYISPFLRASVAKYSDRNVSYKKCRSSVSFVRTDSVSHTLHNDVNDSSLHYTRIVTFSWNSVQIFTHSATEHYNEQVAHLAFLRCIVVHHFTRAWQFHASVRSY